MLDPFRLPAGQSGDDLLLQGLGGADHVQCPVQGFPFPGSQAHGQQPVAQPDEFHGQRVEAQKLLIAEPGVFLEIHGIHAQGTFPHHPAHFVQQVHFGVVVLMNDGHLVAQERHIGDADARQGQDQQTDADGTGHEG